MDMLQKGEQSAENGARKNLKKLKRP